MDKVQAFVARVTEHFDEIPWLKKLSDKTGAPTGYMVLGLIFVCMFLVFSEVGSHFICDLIGILYPAYMSFKAIESPGAEDDKQWLTYWVVFAFTRVGETFFDFFLFWLPFYFLGKLCFLLWLAFPETRGAILIYNRVVAPTLKLQERKIDSALNQAKSAGASIAKEGTNMAKNVAADHAGEAMAVGASLMADKKSS